MIPWRERSTEEQTLLNPGFCSMLLWQAAVGSSVARQEPMPIDLSFLVLPFVLHLATRQTLPRSITTSLPVWLFDHPLVRTRLDGRAIALRPFTREALVFGSLHGLLSVSHAGVRANEAMKKRVEASLKVSSDEVRECAKRAEFLGKWLDKTGTPATTMTLLGVRP